MSSQQNITLRRRRASDREYSTRVLGTRTRTRLLVLDYSYSIEYSSARRNNYYAHVRTCIIMYI